MLNKLRNDDEGFTLIELLVVILIIGVLAAIALPTFLGQRDKAQDSSAKADVRNAVTQIESCLVDGAAGDCDSATESGFPDRVSFVGTPGIASDGTYTISVTSESGNTFRIAKAAPGTYTRSCGTLANGALTASSSGGCNAGAW